MATDTLRGAAARPRPATGLWRDAFGRLRKNKLAMVGLVMVILLFLIAIFGPMIAPYPYTEQDLAAVLANNGRPLPPGSPGHLLGTDQIGRDLLSRLLDGARISMTVAIVVQLVVLVHRRPDRRHGGLVRWPDRQPPDALHRRDVCVPGPLVHHPAVGRVPRDAVRQGDGWSAARVRRDRTDDLGHRRAARPRPDPCPEGDRVRRGGPCDRRLATRRS